MLIIKVWCLPKISEDQFKLLWGEIFEAVKNCPGLEGLGYDKKGAVLVLFPSDLMEWGLGSEILIEVSELDTCAMKARQDLAAKLGTVIKARFPGARILCKVRNRNPADGNWEL